MKFSSLVCLLVAVSSATKLRQQPKADVTALIDTTVLTTNHAMAGFDPQEFAREKLQSGKSVSLDEIVEEAKKWFKDHGHELSEEHIAGFR